MASPKATAAAQSMIDDRVLGAAPSAELDRSSQVLRLPDGRRMGYAEFGDPDGAAVLAIHGTPGSRFMFSLTDEPARQRGLRILAPERPGYGLSDFHRMDALRNAVEDYAVFADALELERFAVLGISGGGPYAIGAAAAMPDRISLLALVSPVGPIADCPRTLRMSRLHRVIFRGIGRTRASGALFFWSLRHVVRRAPDLAYRILLQRVTPSDRLVLSDAEVKANLQAALREGLRHGIQGARQDLRLFCAAWSLNFDELDVPAVIWQGSDDTIVPPAASYYLAEALPHCRLDVIQGGGHYWVFGQIERVLDTLETALRT